MSHLNSRKQRGFILPYSHSELSWSALCAFRPRLALRTVMPVKRGQGSLHRAAEGEERFGTYSEVHPAVNLVLLVLYNQQESRQVFPRPSDLEFLKNTTNLATSSRFSFKVPRSASQKLINCKGT